VTAVTQIDLCIITHTHTHVTYILFSIQEVCCYIYYTESFNERAGDSLQFSDNQCLAEAKKVSTLHSVTHPAGFGI
jgi:hypothetical protein